MKEIEIPLRELTLEFECEECGSTESTSADDAVYNGAPLCFECTGNPMMSFSRCLIDQNTLIRLNNG